MKYELYQDKKGEWRWRLKAKNGQIISMASESYKTRKSCEHGIDLNKSSADAPVVELKND